MPDLFAHSDTNLQTKDRHPQAIPLSSHPDALPTFCWISCVEDRACYRMEEKTGRSKSNRKGLRGLTGKWWDWHWCGVGGFLTRTCWQGWRCSQRDNSAAFSHQRRRPAPNLSGCLSSSGKKPGDPHQAGSLVPPVEMSLALSYKQPSQVKNKPKKKEWSGRK